jgi:hypothetical protein
MKGNMPPDAGLVNDALRSFVIDEYGAAAWEAVVQVTLTCPYADQNSEDIFEAIADQQGQDVDEVRGGLAGP